MNGGKTLHIDSAQAALLKAMGIQVWYPRTDALSQADASPTGSVNAVRTSADARLTTSGSAPATATVRPVEDQAAQDVALVHSGRSDHAEPTAAPVSFAWVKSQHGIAMLSTDAAEGASATNDLGQGIAAHAIPGAYVRFVADLLAYVDWLHGSHEATHQRGEFRWPLLAAQSSGIPTSTSPLRALEAFADKHCNSAAVILMSESLFVSAADWRSALPARLVALPYDWTSMRSGEHKKTLQESVERMVRKQQT